MDKYDQTKASPFDGLFQQSADAHGVSYGLLRKLSWNESRFDPNAKSPTGPVGPMQFTKQTALAMGLKVDPAKGIDERTDPAKAIPAAAKLLGSLVQKYNGDELKAALAYNQGEGSGGSPQLNAYDSGDFSKISPEGVKYMRNLLDVAQSPRLSDLENFGGISPKADGLSLEEITQGVGTAPKVKAGENLPEGMNGVSIKGAEVPEPNVPFGKSFWEAHGESLDDVAERSTFFGMGKATNAEVANSALGMALRAGRVDNGFDVFRDTITPTSWNSHEWSPEELAKIRSEVKDPSYINVVTGGSPENLDALIKLANENYDRDAQAADAGLGAKLTASVVGAGVDPLSYVPVVGAAGKGAKILTKALVVGAQTAGLNVASEGLRTSIAGGEAHYTEAAVGGLLFGAGLSAVADKVAGKANPFAGPTMRLEARETARNADSVDLSRRPIQENLPEEHLGVSFADVPEEKGAVVLGDGSILSASNPVNPKTLKEFAEIDPERAAKGVRFGGLSEVGLVVNRSQNPEILSLGNDLLRSPTGFESGSNGKFGATSSDVIERLRTVDNKTYNVLTDAVNKAMKDPEWSTGVFKTSKAGTRQAIYKRAALAIERPELMGNLTKAEAEIANILKSHFDAKREAMESPSMFGNANAVSIFPGSRHVGTYIPNVYSREMKSAMIAKLGSSDALQDAIKQSWLTSYHSRPEVKARVDAELAGEGDKAIKVTPEMVEKYANDKAYGIAKSDEFDSHIIAEGTERFSEGLAGIDNNQFLKARNLFDSDMSINLPDGSLFSVNELRDFDMRRIMPAYDRRVNGDIAVMGGTGKTTEEVKKQVMSIQEKARLTGSQNDKLEADALAESLKIITGRGRRDPDGTFGTILRGMNDLSFFAKNAYMGVQNVTEVAGMLAQGNVRMMLKAIPRINELALRKKAVSAKELDSLHAELFGKEVDDLMRPTREDIAEAMRVNTMAGPSTIKAVSGFKFATQELAARSPWTKVLNGTTNYLLDVGRQGVLSDVFESALKGRNSRFAKPEMLKSASITPEQWKGIRELISEHAQRDSSGKYVIPNKRAFASDPRAMDLWRMADKVADETMMRPHKVSLQDAKQYGAFAKTFLQFKNFVIKSMNSRFMRGYYEATKNNRAIDQALTWAISGGISAGYYVAQAHVKAAGLPQEQQRGYLDRALDPTMLTYATLSRSSHFGAPLGLANFVMAPLGFDQAKMVRSSILPQGEVQRKEDKAVRGFATTSSPVQNAVTGILEQVPAFGFAANVIATGYNAKGYLQSNSTLTDRDYLTGIMNTTRELVPNDPLTQQLLIHLVSEHGVHLDGK